MVEQSSVVGGSAPIIRWKNAEVSTNTGETEEGFHVPEGIGAGIMGKMDELGVALSMSPL
jgi:hypothetical protein